VGAGFVSIAPPDMPRKPLRSQLNQIRAWVRQGRTDAWIAHQLDVPASELRDFRRRHDLTAEEEAPDLELRDEIEAEIEATMSEEEARAEEAAVEGPEAEDVEEDGRRDTAAEDAGEEDESEATGRRRRRRRRRGGARAGASLQGTFDHGEEEGFGLWLDPAVADDPVYAEHWAGHRPIEVTIERDRIVIRRA
jgi:hypothetical protein